MSEQLPKLLIVDACVLFSFFKKDSARRKVIEKLPNFGCRLISPEFVFEELADSREKIKKSGKVNNLVFAFLFTLLERKIESFPENVYERFLPEANSISPHGKHVTKDDPYFALALALNSPIWSDEEEFKQQDRVEVFNTNELLKRLGLIPA